MSGSCLPSKMCIHVYLWLVNSVSNLQSLLMRVCTYVLLKTSLQEVDSLLCDVSPLSTVSWLGRARENSPAAQKAI